MNQLRTDPDIQLSLEHAPTSDDTFRRIRSDICAVGWPALLPVSSPAPMDPHSGGLGWPTLHSSPMVVDLRDAPISTSEGALVTPGQPPVATPERQASVSVTESTEQVVTSEPLQTDPVDYPGVDVPEDSTSPVDLLPQLPPIGRHASVRRVSVANQKGGVGKTTSTVNVAASLAAQGAEVLVIDLDPQGNASTALGVDHAPGTASIYEVLIGGRPLHEVVHPVPYFASMKVVPASIDLAGAEIELVPVVARELRLRKALDDYLMHVQRQGQTLPEYVFIDCPPSLGLLTVNALVAATEVFIPIQCEYYALEGLGQLLQNIDMIQMHLNPQLQISAILLTMFDSRTRLAAQVTDEVRAHFKDSVLKTVVPRSVRISEAPSHGQTVLTYDPTSTGTWCYMQAANEFSHILSTPTREDDQ
jgi:chromosome partitioning protein